MSVSCEIIKDLLPLYHDNVCSAESRAMVEGHMKECRSCGEVLSAIAEELARPVNAADEAKPIKAMQAILRKAKKKSVIEGAAITILIFAVLIGGFLGLTQWRFIPVPVDLLNVSGVCRLSDGRILYHLDVADNKELRFIEFVITEDGAFYMIPKRAVLESKRTSEIGLFSGYLTFDAALDGANQQGYGVKITSVYIGPEGDGILIWEKGMELPAAGEELEAAFGTDRGIYVENSFYLDIIEGKTHVDLTQAGKLEVSSDELSVYQLYTNSSKITVAIPQGDYAGTFWLYNTQHDSDFIMTFDLNQQNRSKTFTNLTSAFNYYIVASESLGGASITVTD
ncbi:MAG: zf-HC2 domain-containing protein [Oscillospiraceae bacterium]|nr:zf-HC2 domain-containing protein [Oscillospiraceae bacterium]